MKTNIYRCLKPCNNCPFLDNGKAMHLHPDRVDEIKQMLLADDRSSFNCHKTVYNLDSDMNSTQEQDLKMCAGAYEFLQKNGRSNLQMRLAYAMSIDTPPTKETPCKY